MQQKSYNIGKLRRRINKMPRRLVSLIAISVLVFSFAGTARAEPQAPASPISPEQQQSLNSLYIRANQAKAEIRSLDKDLEIATEAYNWARWQLDKTQKQLLKTRKKLDKAQNEFDKQKEAFNQRICIIYKNGESNALEVLLNTKDFTDFLARIHLLLTISKQDVRRVKQLEGKRKEIEKARKELEDLRQDQLQAETQMQVKQEEIEAKLVERTQLLGSIDAQIAGILNTEARQRSEEQQALLRRIFSHAEGADINARPGTIVHTALKYIGVPYVYGAASPAGFDCSGLTMYVYRQHGVELPHYSRAQYALGIPVEPQELGPGDLVFFGNPIHHVGMYIGSGYYIHAPHTGDFVRIARLSTRGDYAGGRRYPIRNR